jgi:16S rRNA G966 N2-methylase RsmD
MWIADGWKDYELIDTSDGLRLERWGKYTLVRPDPQVIWRGVKQDPLWKKADGVYSREGGGGKWSRLAVPESWNIGYGSSLNFKIKPMGFKHTGLFPEQAVNWDWFSELITKANRPVKVLNLFAYTGGATIAAAAAGASVCHVDASKGMVQMAKDKEAKKPEVVFMDPPRNGSDAKFLNSVAQLAPKKVVYISCNPVTQKRDIDVLKKKGYKVEKMQAVDCFCHTYHVENIALLVRK